MFATKFKIEHFVSLVVLTSVASIGLPKSTTAEIVIAEATTSEDFLHQTANTINRVLPMMVDNNTRWDSSYAGPGRSLSYNYTLVNYSAANIDGSVFARNARGILTEKVCNEPTIAIFPQEGVLLNFNYYDNTRNLIARVKIEPSDCGY